MIITKLKSAFLLGLGMSIALTSNITIAADDNPCVTACLQQHSVCVQYFDAGLCYQAKMDCIAECPFEDLN